MAPVKKKANNMDVPVEGTRAMRDLAEKKLNASPAIPSGLTGQTPEQLIHELQVHQIELETQAEELRRVQHELEKSRYQYIDLYEFAPVGYLSLNDKGLVTKANLTAATLLGIGRNKLINRGFSVFIVPEHQSKWHQYIMGHCQNEEKQVINLTIRRGDGTTFPTRLEGIRIPSDDGSPVIHMMVSDISDIAAAQEALRTSHSRLESAMEAGNLAWWEVECSTGKVFFSKRKAEMLGYPVEQFSHYSDFTTLLHPDDYDRTMQAMRDHLSGVKKNYEADYRIRNLNGEYRWFHDTGGISQYGPDGSPLRVTGIVMDSTGRTQADLALHESEVKFRQLFTHMPAAVAVYEPMLDGSDFIFKDFNTAAEAIEGIKKSDLVGKRVSEVFPGVAEFGLFAVFKRVWKTGVAEYYPAALYRDDRHPGTWRENWVYKLASGEIIAIYHDITERKRVEDALRESEERYRGLIDGVPDYILVHRKGKILFVNPAAIKVIGGKEEDLVGYDMMNYIAPESRAFVVEMVMKRAAGEAVPTYEIEIITKGGEKRVTEVHGALIMFQGEPASLNVLSDITERKQAEEALRESEERFHSMFERHESIMLLISPETGNIIEANLAAERFYGRSQKELCTMSINQINTLSPEEVSAEIMKAVREQNNFFTFPHLLASGEIRTVEVHATPINLGGTTVLFSIINDITERKRAEEALRESEEKYRALLFGSGIGVGYWSTEGNLLYLNEISLKRLMAKEESYIGKNIREIFGDDAEKYLERIHASTLSSDPMEYEDYINLPSGKGWYFSVYSCIKGLDGSVKGIQVLSIDITERKQGEEMRERLLNDLKQKNAELERFTYTVSHDLKSPLITIKGFLGYLEKDALDGDAGRLHDDIARIHSATSKMEEFIGALLELSRIGRVVNPPGLISLAFLVENAVEALDAQIRERNVTLMISGDLPEVYGDRVRLQQVMTNLIENAVKFMGSQEEPRIEISAYQEDESVLVCIKDNGIGIEPDDLDKVFSVFTRLDPSIPGSGIGLALVKRIVEVHGGQCRVESEGAGMGTTFCFTLPDKPPANGTHPSDRQMVRITQPPTQL